VNLYWIRKTLLEEQERLDEAFEVKK